MVENLTSLDLMAAGQDPVDPLYRNTVNKPLITLPSVDKVFLNSWLPQ